MKLFGISKQYDVLFTGTDSSLSQYVTWNICRKLFFEDIFIYLFKSYRTRDSKFFHPLVHILEGCNGQGKDRIQELHLGLPHEWLGPKHLVYVPLLFPGH